MSRAVCIERFILSILLLCLALCSQACVSRVPTHDLSPEREGILLVAFGTSVPEARAAFENIGRAYRKEYPGEPLEWAFTSSIIRKKLAAQGVQTSSMGKALKALADAGVNVVRIQSLHIMAGEEFSELARALAHFIKDNPDSFKAVYLGRPLLESRKDALEMGVALSIGLAPETGTAVLLMAHGQKDGRAGLALEGVRSVLQGQNQRFFLATVEGEQEFEEILEELGKSRIRRVILTPLMLVAGEHARNDLAGNNDDSWASRLRRAGYQVEVNMQGLGEREGIAAIFLRHSREARENLTQTPKNL